MQHFNKGFVDIFKHSDSLCDLDYDCLQIDDEEIDELVPKV